MPRQIRPKDLAHAQDTPGSTTGARRTHIRCPGCNRRSGPSQNVQNIKQARMHFAQKGLLAEAPDNSTPNDDALGILSSMGIGFVTTAPKSPSPRSPDDLVAPFASDFSLLQLETDATSIPNARLFDKVSFSKKQGSTLMVKISELYKPPSELGDDESSNIFKPDDNPTDLEKQHRMRIQKISTPNVVKLVEKLSAQQKRISKRSTRLMAPHFKIVYGKQGG